MRKDSFSGHCGQCPTPEEIPGLFVLAKSAAPAVASVAKGKVLAYLLSTHEKFISRHARRDFGNGLSTQDLALTVVKEMLCLDTYADYSHLARIFRMRVASRAVDHLRRCVFMRQAIHELSDSFDEQDPTSFTAELETIDLIPKALEALHAYDSQLAEVVQLRFIAADGTVETFEAIGLTLGISESTARIRFRSACGWLATQFPELESLWWELHS